jgi:hypothetical protein
LNEVNAIASPEVLAEINAIGQESVQAAATPEDKPVEDTSAPEEGEQPESETGDKQEPSADDYSAKGLRKRFHALTSKIRVLEQANAELAAKATSGAASPKAETQEQPSAGKPDPSKFEYGQFDPAYVEALADWKYEQRDIARQQAEAKRKAETEQQTAAQKRQEWVSKAVEAHEDFLEVFDSTVPVSGPMAEFLLESEDGAKLAYHLGRNRDEAKRIAGLGSIAAARELTKLELKLTAPETEKRVATKAPPPPGTVGGRGGNAGAVDLFDPKLSYKEWERAVQAAERRR